MVQKKNEIDAKQSDAGRRLLGTGVLCVLVSVAEWECVSVWALVCAVLLCHCRCASVCVSVS